jgi:hypothetical protein
MMWGKPTATTLRRHAIVCCGFNVDSRRISRYSVRATESSWAFALRHRRLFVSGFIAFVLLSFVLAPFLGRNFFPAVDSGQIPMHVRTQVGTPIEETANQFARIHGMGAAGRHRAMAPDPQTRHHQLIDLCKGYSSASIFRTSQLRDASGLGRCRWQRTPNDNCHRCDCEPKCRHFFLHSSKTNSSGFHACGFSQVRKRVRILTKFMQSVVHTGAAAAETSLILANHTKLARTTATPLS